MLACVSSHDMDRCMAQPHRQQQEPCPPGEQQHE